MTVDLEAIARRGRCDVSMLRSALPLIEQGYTPPFLARYRRDELAGVDEASLWGLAHALHAERATAERREELQKAWEQTSLADPALGHAIRKCNSKRMLDRLARRLKAELAEQGTPSAKLAVRVMNPQRGDADDLLELAKAIDGVEDADAAVAGLDDAIARRLTGDPRIMGAAVRWLAKNARIHIATISDPHTSGADDDDDSSGDDQDAHGSDDHDTSMSDDPNDAFGEIEGSAVPKSQPAVSETAADANVAVAEEAVVAEEAAVAAQEETVVAEETVVVESAGEAETAAVADESTPTSETPSEPAASEPVAVDAAVTDVAVTDPAPAKSTKSAGKKPAKKAPAVAKKPKRVSPRQRRRRWLISVLQPLAGKRIPASKLGSFQILMLSRALRSHVAQCAFEYDAAKLVAEVQQAALGLSRTHGERLSRIVIEHEANIREAAEAAWWDELQEQASARLVTIAGDHLRDVINRGGVEAKVVMSIDAVGPRTAATSIVAADGRILHSEDLPCQLSAALRAQAVSRMGELIHAHGVDLIVISNGPARRASMVAVGDLLAQSPEKSLRWTLADRSGADAYAGSSTADQEMRTTPRRFRAAAWLAFSVLAPGQAFAKVDPLKLRLVSFQRELAEEALAECLDDVMASGASRGGVDANAVPTPWLARLPGMNRELAEQLDARRRTALFSSREDIETSVNWTSQVESRQALAFLRVFGSSETLDGTLIHPEDYALAKKLATALEVELPPSTPPGYQPPNYTVEEKQAAVESVAEVAAEPTDESDESETSSFAEELLNNVDGATATVDEASVDVTAEQESVVAEDVVEPVAEEVVAEDDASSVTEPEAPAPQPVAEESKPVEIAVVRRPKPEKALVDKRIKEWQIGQKRTYQIVNCLCDPFGEVDFGGAPPAVLSSMPSLTALKPGDQVIGVIVGVMPFGVFVELAPDCSGLIHVSKVSESYVEDLHEAVQVGDVITTWVSRIDEKRRRVALSAISPEREAELEQQRNHSRDDRGRDRAPRPPRSGGERAGGERASGERAGGERAGGERAGGGRADSQARPDTRVGQSGGGRPERSGGRPAGGQQGGGAGRGDSRGGGRSDSRGPRSRDDRDGRGGGRGGRAKQPESYRVESTQPKSAPISEAMEKGAEPLRSFGDLLQFYSKKETPEPKTVKPKAEAATKQVEATDQPVSDVNVDSTPAPDNASAENASVVSEASEATTSTDSAS